MDSTSTNQNSQLISSFHKNYKFLEKIGEGYIIELNNLIYRSFGNIWKVQNISTGIVYACKMVKNSLVKEKTLLMREIKILSLLKNKQGFAQIKAYGSDEYSTFFLMDLLGDNLENLRIKYNNFTLPTLINTAIQIIDRIETLHSLKIIHRDIKPENIVIGKEDRTTVFLIDFGLSKFYFFNDKHIQYKEQKGMIGTARYASINALNGIEQSRRDDLEAIGYLLIYLFSGRLPWMNIVCDDKQLKYSKILKMKEVITPENLTFNLPKVFAEYLKYAKSLAFTEQPDYQYLKQIFFTSFQNCSQDLPLQNYDWAKEIESKQQRYKESQTLCNMNDQLNQQLNFWAQYPQQKHHSNQPNPERYQQLLTTTRNRCCVYQQHQIIVQKCLVLRPADKLITLGVVAVLIYRILMSRQINFQQRMN